MTTYCKIEGVDGGVTADGYDKWIQLEDVSLSMSRNVQSVGGKMSDRGAGTLSLSDVSGSKISDVASAKLLEYAIQGTGVKVEIHYVTTGDKPLPYKKITLKDAILSMWAVAGGGGEEKPFESFAFGFAAIEVEFQNYDKSGKIGSKQVVGYDMATMKKL